MLYFLSLSKLQYHSCDQFSIILVDNIKEQLLTQMPVSGQTITNLKQGRRSQSKNELRCSCLSWKWTFFGKNLPLKQKIIYKLTKTYDILMKEVFES